MNYNLRNVAASAGLVAYLGGFSMGLLSLANNDKRAAILLSPFAVTGFAAALYGFRKPDYRIS